jgi:hypothetical protein
MFRPTMNVRGKKGGVLAGAFFGILMLIGSAGVLWVNEGRADLSKIAKEAIVVPQGSAPTEAQGQLVAATGQLAVEEPAFDADFGVRGDYVQLDRKVEMYAWQEHEEDNDRYSYTTEWTSSPANSSQFNQSAGHTNPPLAFQEATFYAQVGIVGSYTFDPSRAHLTSGENVPPGTDLRLPRPARVVGTYIYIGAGLPTQPVVGDVRLSYTAVSTGGTVTLYGLLQGDQIEPFLKDGDKLYGVWAGNHDEALVTMHQEYVTIGWIMRIGGFLLMWFGLNLFVSPLTSLLGFIPVLGRLGQGVIWGINFVIALVVSLVIILVSFVAHRWYLILAVVVVGIGVALFFVLRQRQKAAPA